MWYKLEIDGLFSEEGRVSKLPLPARLIVSNGAMQILKFDAQSDRKTSDCFHSYWIGFRFEFY
jgi:hypothetical protein